MAVNYPALTQAGQLPVVSFSCNSLRFRGRSTTFKLVRLLHSIILQMGDHVSVQDLITLDPNFSSDFLVLDHESDDTMLPLSILKRLLAHRPGFMFLIVDGVQKLDRHEDFEKLLEFLPSIVAERGSSVLKVLLSSDGHVKSLAQKSGRRGDLKHISLESSTVSGHDEDDYTQALEYAM